jgi:hypothetical protein
MDRRQDERPFPYGVVEILHTPLRRLDGEVDKKIADRFVAARYLRQASGSFFLRVQSRSNFSSGWDQQ